MFKPTEFAGLRLNRPIVMGIINVTPDSFSDGGKFFEPEKAIAHGIKLAKEGADILDVGGESTRPGALPTSLEDELARVLPVIKGLAPAGIPISIDTRHPEVMGAAVSAGAQIVNDITSLTGDEKSPELIRRLRVPVVLVHMQGEPRTMQQQPSYTDAVTEVFEYFSERVTTLEKFGIPKSQIAIDPGIGFGKSLDHNLSILGNLDKFLSIGCVLLLGVSRKSFINSIYPKSATYSRIGGSIAAALTGIRRGVGILRVHDVATTCEALSVWSAIEAVDC